MRACAAKKCKLHAGKGALGVSADGTYFVAERRKPPGDLLENSTPEGLRPAATIAKVGGIGLSAIQGKLLGKNGPMP
jgi:hypothetical protein